ncbi:germination protein YpeB [Caldisalinibacter kiritimatiensis]|uniref:Spore germination protein YpeB n=1 Tax=Caldisalinibacter kiritimatiensis TaxID=1304284 RepID=R1CSP6_9FIRM|nr:germination protein YpeB [Caldisalinibacter kiritimatiensis]EOD01681.1 Spore germination protein YpeB [Caldisalinibacter kiritimatiensis]
MKDDKRWILPTVLAVALVVVGVLGITQYEQKNDYKVMLNNQYQRMFYDMKDHVETVQTSLSKALLSDSKEQNILYLSQIWQQALYAQEKLSQLPVKHNNLSKTQKFLNQVGDYCYAMIQNELEDKPMTSEQREVLAELQNYTGLLSKELADIHNKVMKGNLNLNLVRRREDKKLEKANNDMLNTNLTNFEEGMSEYPELIYDGPFSDQVLNIKPKGLGDKEVNKNEAMEIAGKFIGDKKARKFTTFQEGDDVNKAANIPSYTFSVAMENEEKEPGLYISVSKVGGKVIWMANPRNVKDIKLSVDQGLKYAERFLKEKGYENMEVNYSVKYDGVALYNFAYKQGDVTIYPDLIKVKVALDNGEIVGFDASGYLVSHYDRDIPEPKLTQEEARDNVRFNFDIENVRLTIIPKSGKREVLCYEFKGKYNGSDFIVYINALTGAEEEILKVIKDENGTLMI